MTPRFNTLVIDPPWPISMAGKFNDPRHSRPSRLPYKTMTLDEIKAMPVRSVANTGAHVYLWATNKTLRSAFDVLDSWGVAFHQVLVMVKPSGMAPSLGYVFGTEFCLLVFAGRPMQKFTSIGALNWFQNASRRGQHSVKPTEFYKLVERMSPGPYANLFAREKHSTWAAWGDEVESDFSL